MNPAHGTILGDHCTLTEPVAAGGIGEAWAGEATRTQVIPIGAVSATTPPCTTPSDQTLNRATPSTNAATVAAPPANTSPGPGQLNRPRGQARGHDDTKDGKK